MDGIPEDLDIHCQIDGGLTVAVQLLAHLAGASASIHEMNHSPNGGEVALISFAGSGYEILDDLHFQMDERTPETYISAIDEWGFNITIGPALDFVSQEQVLAMVSLADVLGAAVPCVLVDAEHVVPLVDTRLAD